MVDAAVTPPASDAYEAAETPREKCCRMLRARIPGIKDSYFEDLDCFSDEDFITWAAEMEAGSLEVHGQNSAADTAATVSLRARFDAGAFHRFAAPSAF